MSITATTFAAAVDLAGLEAVVTKLINEGWQPAAGVPPVQLGSHYVQRMDQVDDG